MILIAFGCLYLQVCLEGQISRKSAIQSLSEGHQPSGDQIPWKFCEQFRDTVFPSFSGVRIVRIATHPSAMRVSLYINDARLSRFRFL
jgi:N-acetyltransferase 10